MARHLHTAVGDEIRRIAQTDPERATEMRMESTEYRDEVMGRFDYDDDPADYDDYDGREEEPPEDDGDADEFTGPEDLGWDGGREE